MKKKDIPDLGLDGSQPDTHPEACDPATGLCASAARTDGPDGVEVSGHQRIKVVYATDPLCSACWAMEPAWRKLLYHYGQNLQVRYLYGGLLPGWEERAMAGSSIASPKDVALHWEEVAERVAQPIGAGVWRRDPVPSSYPASEAAHAVRVLDPSLEPAFLHRLRVAIFVEEQNIARREVLLACADEVGINTGRLATLLEAGVGKEPFRRDLQDAKRLGVRVFPTLLLYTPEDSREVLVGERTHEELESALCRSGVPRRTTAPPTIEQALRSYGSGTLAEFAELLDLTLGATRNQLEMSGASRAGRDETWVALNEL